MLNVLRNFVRRDNKFSGSRTFARPNDWTMRDVKMWCEEIREIMNGKQQKQKVKYGNRTFEVDKHESLREIFATEGGNI